MEAKCWTCGRGNAKPDPAGCEYIRSGGQLIPEGARIDVKYSSLGHRLQKIIFCPGYLPTPPRRATGVVETDQAQALKIAAQRKARDRRRSSAKWAALVAERAKIPRYCQQCGGIISPTKTQHAKFCTIKCCQKHNREVRKGKKTPLCEDTTRLSKEAETRKRT